METTMETKNTQTLEDIKILFGRPLDLIQKDNKSYKINITIMYLFDILICCSMTYILTKYGTKFSSLILILIAVGVFINVLVSSGKKAENASLYSIYKKYKKYEVVEKKVDLNAITDKFILHYIKKNNTDITDTIETLDNLCCKKYEYIYKLGTIFDKQTEIENDSTIVYLIHYKKKTFYIGRKL